MQLSQGDIKTYEMMFIIEYTADYYSTGFRMASPEGCPTAVYSLMRDCWEQQPEKRPHFNRIVIELRDAHSTIVR